MRIVTLALGFAAAPAFAGGPTLDIDGACPGRMDIQVTGATPGRTVAFLKGAGPGSDVIPAGPCAGTRSNLSGVGLVTTLRDGDGDGVLRMSPSIPAPACGSAVQVLDMETCTVSNLASLGDGDDCVPTGDRAPLDVAGADTVSGCWDGDFCGHDDFLWESSRAKIFAAFEESASCTGPATCIANVGITTYNVEGNCQGAFDVLCDGEWVGTIDTVGRACGSSAMADGCDVSFPARRCSEVTFVSVPSSSEEPTGCCGWDAPPDSAIASFSAW